MPWGARELTLFRRALNAALTDAVVDRAGYATHREAWSAVQLIDIEYDEAKKILKLRKLSESLASAIGSAFSVTFSLTGVPKEFILAESDADVLMSGSTPSSLPKPPQSAPPSPPRISKSASADGSASFEAARPAPSGQVGRVKAEKKSEPAGTKGQPTMPPPGSLLSPAVFQRSADPGPVVVPAPDSAHSGKDHAQNPNAEIFVFLNELRELVEKTEWNKQGLGFFRLRVPTHIAALRRCFDEYQQKIFDLRPCASDEAKYYDSVRSCFDQVKQIITRARSTNPLFRRSAVAALYRSTAAKISELEQSQARVVEETRAYKLSGRITGKLK